MDGAADGEIEGDGERWRAQGVGSSWAAMVSSILASPPGRVGQWMFAFCFDEWLRTGCFGAVHVEGNIFADCEGLKMGVCHFRLGPSAEITRPLFVTYCEGLAFFEQELVE